MVMPRFGKSYRHSHHRSREKGNFATKYGNFRSIFGSISLSWLYLAETETADTRQSKNTPCASYLHGISLGFWGPTARPMVCLYWALHSGYQIVMRLSPAEAICLVGIYGQPKGTKVLAIPSLMVMTVSISASSNSLTDCGQRRICSVQPLAMNRAFPSVKLSLIPSEPSITRASSNAAR